MILLLLTIKENSYSQLYFQTLDVLHNTKYIRKKQTVHSIRDAALNNGNLVINLTATLDRKLKKRAYHISLPIDSIISYYKNKPYFYYHFDSSTEKKFGVISLERRYTNITNRRIAGGIDVMCSKEILIPGFSAITNTSDEPDTLEILSGKKYSFESDHKTGRYLKGKHLVFLFYFNTPKMVDGESIDYLVINIENNHRVNKLNYLKLPYTLITDTILFPFSLMLSGMQK